MKSITKTGEELRAQEAHNELVKMAGRIRQLKDIRANDWVDAYVDLDLTADYREPNNEQRDAAVRFFPKTEEYLKAGSRLFVAHGAEFEVLCLNHEGDRLSDSDIIAVKFY